MTLPARVIGDTSLTALDLRCLAVIAMHDGMSAVSGKGGGCYARNQTLAALARTDATNFSKSLTRLMKAGYVTREPQLMDKRRFTLRVQYPRDNSWRDDQQSPPSHDPETGEIVGEPANPAPEIVGDGEGGNGGFSRETGSDYISLNEELDSVETEELHSLKGRTVPARGLAGWREAFDRLPDGAKVARFEEAWKAHPEWFEPELERWARWLFDVADTYQGENNAIWAQAGRLWEEIAPC
jgi:hypothetical protein